MRVALLSHRRGINMAASPAKISKTSRREQIDSGALAVCRGLEALKSEHENFLETLGELVDGNDGDVHPVEREKIDILQSSLVKIDSGLEEAKVRAQLSCCS